MTDIAYLNQEFVPLSEAKISPLDRGFLFGDGIYEVIPVHHGRPVALQGHLKRLSNGLKAIGIQMPMSQPQWHILIDSLIAKNQRDEVPFQGLYLHVSRGADSRRHHSFPTGITPTVFAYTFAIPAPPNHDKTQITPLKVGLSEDLRWKRCHIKSTSLLGNVLHFQQGAEQGVAETVLHNSQGQITEASACNVFIVKNGIVRTPPLDHQLLPGITRQLVLKALKTQTDIPVEETFFDTNTLFAADEVWLTSSTKEIAPVSHVDSKIIGSGTVGEVWERAIKALDRVKFE